MQLRPEESEERRHHRLAHRLARRAWLVGWAKVLLPLGAVLLIVAIFWASRDRGDVTDLFTPEELARLGAGLELEKPRLAGVTSNDQPYEFTASVAMPDGPMAERISFDAPAGRLETTKREIAAAAGSGVLDRGAERLQLADGVSIRTSDGWEGRTDRMEIELDTRTARGSGAVRATGPSGSLEAGSFRARETGDGDGPTIWFENGVRVLFTPAPGD